MSKKPFQSILESEASKIYSKHRSDIVDILLFGSAARGKEKPNDIDILIIFIDRIDYTIAQELKNSVGSLTKINVEVTPKNYASLFDENFPARESILTEGYSLINKIGIAHGLGFEPYAIFVYSLKEKTKSQRMMFYYALHGRTTEGMLAKLNAKRFTDTAIICPVGSQEEMASFFTSHKIEFKEWPVIVPARLTS